jgi:hypothetical protein
VIRGFLLPLSVLITFIPGVFAAQDPLQEQDPVYVFGTTVVIPSGLEGKIYFISHSAKNLTELEKDKPRGTIYTSSLNIPPQDYKMGFPGIAKRLEWFAIDYTGKFWIASPGEYQWELMSDDGSLLYIDGQQVIDNSGLHPPVTLHGKTQLTAGIHTIRVSYFQGLKFSVALVLKIAESGKPFRVFSTEEFRPPSDLTTGTSDR